MKISELHKKMIFPSSWKKNQFFSFCFFMWKNFFKKFISFNFSSIFILLQFFKNLIKVWKIFLHSKEKGCEASQRKGSKKFRRVKFGEFFFLFCSFPCVSYDVYKRVCVIMKKRSKSKNEKKILFYTFVLAEVPMIPIYV